MLKYIYQSLNKAIVILLSLNFFLSLYLISNIYDYRISFAKNEKLSLKKEDLQFKKDLLLKQLEELKSQLTLRRVAVGRLNMTTPSSKNLVFIKKLGNTDE